MPASKQEVTIVDSVTFLLGPDDPRREVIVVNDRSKDRTLEVLQTGGRSSA